MSDAAVCNPSADQWQQFSPSPDVGKPCRLKPLGMQIVVLRDREETMTRGGIVLPDQAKEKPRRGTVMAVGDGEWREGGTVRCSLKPGDRVYFSHYAGTEINVEGTPYLIMNESEVMARWDGGE